MVEAGCVVLVVGIAQTVDLAIAYGDNPFTDWHYWIRIAAFVGFAFFALSSGTSGLKEYFLKPSESPPLEGEFAINWFAGAVLAMFAAALVIPSPELLPAEALLILAVSGLAMCVCADSQLKREETGRSPSATRLLVVLLGGPFIGLAVFFHFRAMAA